MVRKAVFAASNDLWHLIVMPFELCKAPVTFSETGGDIVLKTLH